MPRHCSALSHAKEHGLSGSINLWTAEQKGVTLFPLNPLSQQDRDEEV
jgi:hypothetical protein